MRNIVGAFLVATAGGATAAFGAPQRQTVVVECGDACESVAAALRRMGGEIAPRSRAGDRISVTIERERIAEIPMLRGVRAASKVPERPAPVVASKTAAARRARSGERLHEPIADGSVASRLIAPGRGVALDRGSPEFVRTARAAGEAAPIQRSSDVAVATAEGQVAQNDLVPVLVDVPPGTRELSFVLLWENEAGDDIDLILLTPEGDADVAGITSRNPERAVVRDPTPGVWTAFVNGFSVNGRSDQWQLGVTADGLTLPSR